MGKESITEQYLRNQYDDPDVNEFFNMNIKSNSILEKKELNDLVQKIQYDYANDKKQQTFIKSLIKHCFLFEILKVNETKINDITNNIKQINENLSVKSIDSETREKLTKGDFENFFKPLNDRMQEIKKDKKTLN